MPYARGSTRSRIVSTRRRTGWEEGPGVNTQFSSAGSIAGILGAGQAFVVDGNTIVRMRGFFELILKTAVSAGDGFIGAIGIGVVDMPAFTVGVTAVPTPITEVEWEGWLWHEFFQLTSPTVTAGITSSMAIRHMIDSKAMRKIESDRTVYAAIEMTEVGDSSITATLGTRMLLKLA